jgi:hypothetical protein
MASDFVPAGHRALPAIEVFLDCGRVNKEGNLYAGGIYYV